jgi:hypothetical protein
LPSMPNSEMESRLNSIVLADPTTILTQEQGQDPAMGAPVNEVEIDKFENLKEFSDNEKQTILDNFVKKHPNMVKNIQDALNYINEAIAKKGKKEIIEKLKCYV